jgi:hypothetical protein
LLQYVVLAVERATETRQSGGVLLIRSISMTCTAEQVD